MAAAFGLAGRACCTSLLLLLLSRFGAAALEEEATGWAAAAAALTAFAVAPPAAASAAAAATAVRMRGCGLACVVATCALLFAGSAAAIESLHNRRVWVAAAVAVWAAAAAAGSVAALPAVAPGGPRSARATSMQLAPGQDQMQHDMHFQ